MMINSIKNKLIFTGLLLLFIPLFFVKAEESSFIVEKNYSENGKQIIRAELVESGEGLNFYIETEYWKTQKTEDKQRIIDTLLSLDKEFINNIKPKLNMTFGTEDSPGIDQDHRITVLFHFLKGNTRGYIRNVDSYSKINNPSSNEREMVYLNALHINNQYLKEFLTHEYMHLITINQKEKRIGKSEATWLNEALSEYAVTHVGYNEKENSYIDNRVSLFINNPSTSLVNWSNQSTDYGVVNLFTHYLVEQYGIDILTGILQSSKTGIDAVNESLIKNGFKEVSIKDVFTDFSIAVHLNDCSISEKYCFKNEKLKNMKVLTLNNFLPISGDSNIFLGQTLSPFSAQYQKFIGGSGNIKFKFKGNPSGFFSLNYIVKKTKGETIVHNLKMPASNQEGEVIINNMSKDVSSIVFIPSVTIPSSYSTDTKFYYSLSAANFTPVQSLPIKIDKPLNQMTKEELMNTVLRLLIYLLLNQSRYPAT